MSGGRRMGCSSWKGIASRSPWDVSGDPQRERNLLEATETGFLSNFFEP